MLPYFAMYLYPAVLALMPLRGDATLRRIAWGFFWIFYVAMIGLRHDVGGDWDTYADLYRDAIDAYFDDFVLVYKDPGYAALNWLAAWFDLGVYGVNLFCAALFTSGLVAFVRRQPYSWIAAAVAVPHFVVVVAMGFTRQGAALGLVLLALVALEHRHLFRYTLLMLAAATFHKTALPFLLLPLVMPGRWGAKTIILTLAVGVAWMALSSYAFLWEVYVDDPMEASGGFVRILMNVVPALLFFVFWVGWHRKFADRWMWGWFALLAIASVFLVGSAPSAVDRIAIYIGPLQIVVFSRVPLLIRDGAQRAAFALGVLGMYGLVLWVWLAYADHAPEWVPYHNILFG